MQQTLEGLLAWTPEKHSSQWLRRRNSTVAFIRRRLSQCGVGRLPYTDGRF
jgi:hypothetical protein